MRSLASTPLGVPITGELALICDWQATGGQGPAPSQDHQNPYKEIVCQTSPKLPSCLNSCQP
jgi:hypothetical protein